MIVRVEKVNSANWERTLMSLRMAGRARSAGEGQAVIDFSDRCVSIVRRELLAAGTPHPRIVNAGQFRQSMSFAMLKHDWRERRDSLAQGYYAEVYGHTAGAIGGALYVQSKDYGFTLQHKQAKRNRKIMTKLRVLNSGFVKNFRIAPVNKKALIFPVLRRGKWVVWFSKVPVTVMKGAGATHFFDRAKVHILKEFLAFTAKYGTTIVKDITTKWSMYKSVYSQYRGRITTR